MLSLVRFCPSRSGRRGHWGQWQERPASSAGAHRAVDDLHRPLRRVALGAANIDPPVGEVDVAPAKLAQLACAQPRKREHREDRPSDARLRAGQPQPHVVGHRRKRQLELRRDLLERHRGLVAQSLDAFGRLDQIEHLVGHAPCAPRLTRAQLDVLVGRCVFGDELQLHRSAEHACEHLERFVDRRVRQWPDRTSSLVERRLTRGDPLLDLRGFGELRLLVALDQLEVDRS